MGVYAHLYNSMYTRTNFMPVCEFMCVRSAKTDRLWQPMSHCLSITRLIAMATLKLQLANSVAMISELDVSAPPSQS